MLPFNRSFATCESGHMSLHAGVPMPAGSHISPRFSHTAVQEMRRRNQDIRRPHLRLWIETGLRDGRVKVTRLRSITGHAGIEVGLVAVRYWPGALCESASRSLPGLPPCSRCAHCPARKKRPRQAGGVDLMMLSGQACLRRRTKPRPAKAKPRSPSVAGSGTVVFVPSAANVPCHDDVAEFGKQLLDAVLVFVQVPVAPKVSNAVVVWNPAAETVPVATNPRRS